MSNDFQVILRNKNGLPEDDYVNTFYFRGGAAQTDEGIADGIAQAYTDNLLAIHPSSIGGMTIKGYNPGRNPGGPDFEKDYAYAPATDPGGPAEVALCLSYYAGQNTGRRRGRAYIGPLARSAMGGPRPDSQLRNILLEFASDLSGAGGADALWCVYSRADDAYRDVTNWWVDDAWDTQRRRGAKPTTRSTGS